jgi:hypothetical protein
MSLVASSATKTGILNELLGLIFSPNLSARLQPKLFGVPEASSRGSRKVYADNFAFAGEIFSGSG